MNIVQCQVCTAILYDAERGPILAAIQHRETCSPMRSWLVLPARTEHNNGIAEWRVAR